MRRLHKFLGVCLACLVVVLWGVSSAAGQCPPAGWLPGEGFDLGFVTWT
jgi:hypothetical protein